MGMIAPRLQRRANCCASLRSAANRLLSKSSRMAGAAASGEGMNRVIGVLLGGARRGAPE